MSQDQSRTTDEKIALITGASGGIGLGAGLALIRAGYRVIGTSRHAAPNEVRQGIHMIPCDVTNDESVRQLVKDVVARASSRSGIYATEETISGSRKCVNHRSGPVWRL